MSNVQFVHSLGKIESIVCNKKMSSWQDCVTLIERVMKLCNCFRGRRSFPCLQDQAVIAFLLNVASCREEAMEYLRPHFETVLDIVAEYMNTSLAADREFIIQVFTKMVKINSCVKEVTDILSAYFLENGDVFSAELYWTVLSIIVRQKETSTVFEQISIQDISRMIFNIASDPSGSIGSATGAVTASMTLASSLIMQPSLWTAMNEDSNKSTTEDAFTGLSSRMTLVAALMGWCRSLLSLRDGLDTSQHSLMKDESDDFEGFSNIDSLPLDNVWKLHPSVLVCIVVAMLTCCQVDASYADESLEASLMILRVLLSISRRIKGQESPGGEGKGWIAHLAPVLVSKALVAFLGSVDKKEEIEIDSSPFVLRMLQLLSRHVLSEVVQTNCISPSQCTAVEAECAALLKPLLMGNGESCLSPSGEIFRTFDERVSLLLYGNRYPHITKPTAGLLVLLFDCYVKDYELVGWSQSSFKVFIEQCVQCVCHEALPRSHGDVSDTWSPLDNLTASSHVLPTAGNEESTKETCVCRLLELITIVFDCLCMPSGTDHTSSDMDLAFAVADHIHTSLLDIVSFSVLSCSRTVVYSACAVLAKVCVSFPDSFLTDTIEWLCCTMTRTYAIAMNSAEQSVDKTIDVLEGFATAIQLIVTSKSYIENDVTDVSAKSSSSMQPLQPKLLEGVLLTLLNLFAKVANESLGAAVKYATTHGLPLVVSLSDPSSCLSIGLCPFIHVIAQTMESLCTGSAHGLDQIDKSDLLNGRTFTDISLLRVMWMHLALLNFADKSRWSNEFGASYYSKICQAVDRLAHYTPPLVDFQGGCAVGFLEKELAFCSIAKVFMKFHPDKKSKDTARWIDDCTGLNVLEELLPTATFGTLSANNTGAMLYISAVQYLENTRISAHTEARPMFYYLCSDEITSSMALQGAILHIARKHLFRTWESTVMATPNVSVKINAVIDFFRFVVTRTVHSSRTVRKLAGEFVSRVYQCSPWVYWHKDLVFTLFECLEVVTCLKNSETRVLSSPACLTSSPWKVSLFLNTLPVISFPGSNDVISSVAMTVISMCYEWFVVASDRASSVIHEILHEYILICGNSATYVDSDRYVDVGVSIANEICSSNVPNYHDTSHNTSELFHAERVLAASKISEQYKHVFEKSVIASKSPMLVYKAGFAGEASSVVQNIIKASSSSPSRNDTDQQDLMENLMRPFYSFFDDVIASGTSCEEAVSNSLKNAIMKNASIIREMCLIVESASNLLSEALVREHSITSLQYFSALLRRFFSGSMVSCMVLVWRWLATSSSMLTPLVMENTLSCFELSARLRLGLFNHRTSACEENFKKYKQSASRVSGSVDTKADARVRNVSLLHNSDILCDVDNLPFLNSSKPSRDCTSGYRAHEDWVDFLSECLSTYSEHSEAIFDAVEAALSDEVYFSRDSFSLVVRFKLLCLGFKLLKDSLVATRTNAKKNRRYIVRERVFHLALLWFSETPSFPGIKSKRICEEFFVLKEFVTLLREDAALWVVEYANEVSYDIDELGERSPHPLYTRGPGHSYALKHLRKLMHNGPESSSRQNQHRRHHDSHSPIHLGIDVPIKEEVRASYKPGLVFLLQAFVYHYMDSLIATIPTYSEDTLSKKEIDAFRVEYKIHTTFSERTSKLLVEVAWVIEPSLAISFVEQFRHKWECHQPKTSSHGNVCKALSTLLDYISCNPSSVRGDYRAVSFLPLLVDTSEKQHRRRPKITKELIHWCVSPVHVALNLLSRRPMGIVASGDTSNSTLHVLPLVVHYAIRSLRAMKKHHIRTLKFFLAQMVQLLRRDAYGQLGCFISELALSSTLLCHQLIWLLQLESVDENDQNKKEGSSHGYIVPREKMRHGYCRTLRGPDPLPILATDLLRVTRNALSTKEKAYLDDECEFFNKVTNISAKLKEVKNKELHNSIIKESLLQLGKPEKLYLPTNPFKLVVDIVVDSGAPMQSAAKCPYLLVFHTRPWGGPDSMRNNEDSDDMSATSFCGSDIGAARSRKSLVDVEKKQSIVVSSSPTRGRGIGKMDSASFTSPKVLGGPRSSLQERSAHRLRAESFGSDEDCEDGEFKSSKDEFTYIGRPSIVPMKGEDDQVSNFGASRSGTSASGTSVGDPNDLADLVIELESQEKQISSKICMRHDQESKQSSSRRHLKHRATNLWSKWIGASSRGLKAQRRRIPFRPSLLAGHDRRLEYPVHETENPETTDACIFKVYDDCRQDALTIQVIKILRDAFEAVDLPLFLQAYNVVPNRTGDDLAQGGILEVVANVKSRDQLGKEGAKTLKQYFINQFGDEESPSYKQAQIEFARSLAGYAIVCYLLSIKDRHSGNILIDGEGHLIHIDFGFLLGISPGGNMGFENAAFKLSKEMVELLGGSIDSAEFKSFEDLTVKAFLVARSVMEPILVVVSTMIDSGLPCFLHREDNISDLRDRFFPQFSDCDAASHMRRLVKDAANKWTTVAYDGIQKLQNNIYSDSWK